MKKFKKIMGLNLLICLLFSSAVFANTYILDPVYSNVIFKIKHLTGYNVGSFDNFTGLIKLNEDNTQLQAITAKIHIPSINTRHLARDKDLLSEKFFDAEKYPVATFVGKEVKGNQIIGDLTLRGKTKEIAMDYVYGGVAKDQFGRTKIGLSARGKINRKNFGMTFNKKIDRKQMLLGDEVEIIVEVQGLSVKDPIFERKGIDK